MERLTSSIIVFAIIAISASGAPDIIGHTGQLAHGETITITGYGFGTKTPAAPLWWDDGEGAPAGTQINRTGELPWVKSGVLSGGSKHYNDAWPRAVTEDGGEANIKYRTSGYRNVTSAYPENLVFIAGCHDDQGECLGGEVGQNVALTVGDTSRHDTWYVSYYLRLDPLWPISTSQNYKWFNWEQGNPRPLAYSSPFCYDNTNGCNCGTGPDKRSSPGCGFDYWSGASVIQILGASCADQWTSPGCGTPILSHNTAKANPQKQWTKNEHIMVYPEYYKYYVDNSWFLDTTKDADCSLNTATYTSPSAVTIGGFWRQDMCGNSQDDLNDDACRFFDDIYVDTTLSRVVLADNEDYSLARVVEPQIPVEWSDGSISFHVNLGGVGDEAYLFVFNSDNIRNPTGYSLTLGAGCGDGICSENCSTCPSDCGACPVNCVHPADSSPCDGTISAAELSAYMAQWRQGTTVSISQLIDAIRLWKG